MRAVISVIGTDAVGILHKVSGVCYENNCNIVDVNQKVMQGFFTMVMIVEIDACKVPFSAFCDQLDALGRSMGLTVHAMHEDIFHSMHRI